MTSNTDSLVLGLPRFNDSSLEKTLVARGRRGCLAPSFSAFSGARRQKEFPEISPWHSVRQTARFFLRRPFRHPLSLLSPGRRHAAVCRTCRRTRGCSSEIDPQAIFDYLYFHAIPSPRTIYKGIYRVPPAHYVLFENGQLTVAPYWIPTFEEVSPQPFDQLRDEFRALLQQATARQLDGGKAGCFLSGGTDSSTVAGMIGLAHGSPAATYSIGFEAEGYDEMAFARIAANRYKTEHHEYYVTPDDLVRSIPMVAASYDQPFGNSSALPAYYCAKMAKDDGITRILAGDGGDELFGGNSRYAKQRIFDWYQHIPGAVRRGVMEPLLGTSLAGRLPLYERHPATLSKPASRCQTVCRCTT